jgi:hypothetical protein
MALVPNHHTETAHAPDNGGAPPTSIRDLLEKPARDANVPKPVRLKPGKKGYGAHDRRELDRLFETTGSGGSGKP